MGPEPRHSDLPWAPALRPLGLDGQVEGTGGTHTGRQVWYKTTRGDCLGRMGRGSGPRGVPQNPDVPFGFVCEQRPRVNYSFSHTGGRDHLL